ncbi:tRNA synthetase class II (D K and N) [Dehalogenimonas lykanthroporepellens BL-DC-9]|nr:tRNA synthetase class II (D K and N) [Dehalogenimonas lykanthroporepellens BL-DC-9]
MDIERLTKKGRSLRRRAEIIKAIRDFFLHRDYLEVETPLLTAVPIPETHIDAIATDRGFLVSSPEIYMKPLLAAGYDRIFQICHSFRKNEIGTHHLEEFSMLEYYRAGFDYLELAGETEELVLHIAGKLGTSGVLNYQNRQIDLSGPWERLTVREAFIKACDWDPLASPDPERFDLELATSVAGLSYDKPLVLYDFPADMASLSRLKSGNPAVAERTELFIGGLEVANIFSELTDVEEQRRRFIAELSADKSKPQAELPEAFLEALRYLPESAGGALGVDRLVMLFCDAADIREVNFFPI